MKNLYIIKHNNYRLDTYKVINNNVETVYNITYDINRGLCITSFMGNNYSYEGRKLVSYNNYNYQYNANGRRIRKYNNSNVNINYYYDIDNKLILEDRGTYKIRYLYDSNNIIYGFVKEDTSTNMLYKTYYYLRNELGIIYGIMNEDGLLIGTYRYNAYGKILEIKVRYWTDINDTFINECNEILNLNPIRYKSYYYDTESNMYYLNNRYYNPLICRFITPDEYEYIDINNSLSYNIYAYCNNNPVMYSDGDGHLAILSALLIGAGIGSLFGGLTAGLTGAINGDTGLQLLGDIFGGALVGGALGLATCAGGLAGLGAFSGWSLVGAIGGTTALSLGAGVAQSAINQYSHTGEIKLGDAFIDGGITAFQSLVSFGLGAAMSSSGMWKSLGQKSYSNSIKLFADVSTNKVTAFLNGNLLYFEQNGLQIAGRTFVKNIFTIPYSLLKKVM